MPDQWHDLGPTDTFGNPPLRQVLVDRLALAVSCVDGVFGAVSGVCNHAGGPLGDGALDGDYITCPWHYWKFHRVTGLGEPGFEDDRIPSHEVRVEGGRLLVNLTPSSKRNKKPHAPHPLARREDRVPGLARVLGISTTAMDPAHPRFSGSDALLTTALSHAAQLGHETKMIRLTELAFRACEGFYSKSAHACTWPCSITQLDPKDQMERVYEGIVHWADVVLVATPIRWGSASSLYFKMCERLNCVQNQVTIANRVLIKNKVAAFIIVGGQDNVQGVAGQMLGFFTELGFHMPQFAYIAHSRGWSAEDMERNVDILRTSEELHAGARELAERALALSKTLLESAPVERVQRGGRKAHGLAPREAT